MKNPAQEGLTMLADALGGAVIGVPLAATVCAFGPEAGNETGRRVDGALANA
jgi:hypothetical protein